METITIDGMDEHLFRHSIEDMLRQDKAAEAIDRLRALLEPYAGEGGILPPRLLEVTSADVEFTGWHKLANRLRHPDRPSHPISAIGIVLADVRTLGGPGPQDGRLAPFIKTFYFDDNAFPFSDATRDDLLDGYSRDGFGWQGDYQTTDAALSIKGLDDLYGAIVELEDRLFDRAKPSLDEIRAGSIGACYVAALIHQALRETIRERGLPQKLCVLAACDGVYPFFDAPVAGWDECKVEESAKPATEEATPTEPEVAAPADGEEPDEDWPPAASLLGAVSRKRTKRPVIVLGEDAAREAAEFTEMASAQRMVVDDELALKGLFEGVPPAELAETGPAESGPAEDWVEPEAPSADATPFWRDPSLGVEWPDDPPDSHEEPAGAAAAAVAAEPRGDRDEDDPDAFGIAELPEDAEELTDADVERAREPFTPPARHSLRGKFNLAQQEADSGKPGGIGALLDWLRRAFLRR